jgi:hypothetical protein
MTKYHSVKAEARGHIFDSKAERDYYLLHLLPLKQSGEIKKIIFQPKYELQPGFSKNGKRYRAITYIADFEVIYADGHREIIDVKGVETKVFRIKHKLFEYKYPKLSLKIVKGGE